MAGDNSHDCQNVEHLYDMQHPKRRDERRHSPSVVLACRKCNNERGAPGAKAFEVCPAIRRQAA
jgi:hypothetical protein